MQTIEMTSNLLGIYIFFPYISFEYHFISLFHHFGVLNNAACMFHHGFFRDFFFLFKVVLGSQKN